MFRIHARGYTGWLAWCFFAAGLLITLGGLLMSRNDIEFTAFGLVELGGGQVATLPTNVFDWFSVGVLSVGSISLLVGRLIGLTISLIQFTVIQREETGDSQVNHAIPVDPKTRMLIWGLIVFNLMTTWYYLNGNTFLDLGNASFSAIINGGLKSLWTFLAAFALFSFGPEWVVVYGISLTRANWPNVVAFFSDEALRSKPAASATTRRLDRGKPSLVTKTESSTQDLRSTPEALYLTRSRRSGNNGRDRDPN